jgi:hypothetical protein
MLIRKGHFEAGIGSKILEKWSLNLAGLGMLKVCEHGDGTADSILVCNFLTRLVIVSFSRNIICT